MGAFEPRMGLESSSCYRIPWHAVILHVLTHTKTSNIRENTLAASMRSHAEGSSSDRWMDTSIQPATNGCSDKPGG